jgi:hypothetical protein
MALLTGSREQGKGYSCPRKTPHNAKTQYRKFETNIPRKGTARLQSQFLHSCFCERFIYSSDRSAYPAAGNRWAERGNTYMQIAHRHMNVQMGLMPRNSFSGNSNSFAVQVSISCVLFVYFSDAKVASVPRDIREGCMAPADC